ncbi:hypothetical protein [Halomonas sp.]|uniref:hypothetical protein n=1 Tax=unclassified Halomonas TaxID=2609666 RepID=UPI003F8D932B
MYPVSIKGVLLLPANKVVLALNDRDEWELPGGRIEIGEVSSECLERVRGRAGRKGRWSGNYR